MGGIRREEYVDAAHSQIMRKSGDKRMEMEKYVGERVCGFKEITLRWKTEALFETKIMRMPNINYFYFHILKTSLPPPLSHPII